MINTNNNAMVNCSECGGKVSELICIEGRCPDCHLTFIMGNGLI